MGIYLGNHHISTDLDVLLWVCVTWYCSYWSFFHVLAHDCPLSSEICSLVHSWFALFSDKSLNLAGPHSIHQTSHVMESRPLFLHVHIVNVGNALGLLGSPVVSFDHCLLLSTGLCFGIFSGVLYTRRKASTDHVL